MSLTEFFRRASTDPHPPRPTGRARLVGTATWLMVGAAVSAFGADAPATRAGAAPKIDFTRQVRPILANRCFRCHGPDAETRQAGLRLDLRDGALAKLDSGGVAIVPGSPERSPLVARIASTDPEHRMPPRETGDPLKPAEQQILREWIRQGADYAPHWAYVAPVRPAVPTGLSRPQWVRNPIDAFVLARLDRLGRAPSPEADRATLVRRLALDLTGLPPTPGEVDAFVGDVGPRAEQRLVDRLLASDAYGERWAHVWLDLARYADSAGYAQDPPRTIWKYRDWVIRALNDNLPFDRFTIEQLAGDLLPHATEPQLVATGFHRNTMTNSEGGTNDEEFRSAAIVDRVNTTMQVWMGLTFGCAQCHSHKYDPFTQREYFQVFALFNQTEDADRGDESPNLVVYSPEETAERKRIEAEIATLEQQVAAERQATPATPAPPKDAPAASPAPAPSGTPLPRTGPVRTRFVRVELPGPARFLHLAEVQVFVAGKNVAPMGIATQSSTAYDGPAKLANDGNTNGDYFAAKSVSHTDEQADPWWEVDLKEPQAVERIVVWNRTDGGVGARTKGARIVALDEQRQPVSLFDLGEAPNPSAERALPATFDRLSEADRTKLAAYGAKPASAPTGAKPGNAPAAPLTETQKKLDDAKKRLAAIKGTPTPIFRELAADKQRTTRIQHRGNFLDLGEVVTPGVPAAFPPLPSGAPANRLTFARWLVDPRNPLTARVTVNRLWEELFGLGLVETSEDFGIQGEPPAHPELLDWLAVELVESGWDVKHLLRTIVDSAVYRQSSAVPADLAQADPRNRLLARGPRFRLSAEVIRDQALAVAGLLSRKMYGPSVQPPRPKLGLNSAFGGSTDWQTSPGEDKFRRGLYTSWRRTTPYPSMTTFDAPSREVCTIRRIRTNTPLQALVVLNDPVYVEAAQGLARRVLREGGPNDAQRIDHAFRLCTARRPTDRERARVSTLLERAREKYRAQPDAAKQIATVPLGPPPENTDLADLAAWTLVSNTLMNLDEFLARR